MGPWPAVARKRLNIYNIIYIYIYTCARDDQVQRILESNLPYVPDRFNPSKIGWLVKFNPFGSQLSHVNLKFPMCKSRHSRKNSQLCHFARQIRTFQSKSQLSHLKSNISQNQSQVSLGENGFTPPPPTPSIRTGARTVFCASAATRAQRFKRSSSLQVWEP